MCFQQDVLEARVGIEPTHKGFADLSLTTWVPRLNLTSIAKIFAACQANTRILIARMLLDLSFAQETRGFFRRRRVDVKAGAPLKTRHFGQLRNDFDVPVVVIV